MLVGPRVSRAAPLVRHLLPTSVVSLYTLWECTLLYYTYDVLWFGKTRKINTANAAEVIALGATLSTAHSAERSA